MKLPGCDFLTQLSFEEKIIKMCLNRILADINSDTAISLLEAQYVTY